MKARDVSEILRQFDNLPDSALVPQKVSALLLGESPRSLRRKKPMPSFPINGAMRGHTVGHIRRELAKRVSGDA